MISAGMEVCGVCSGGENSNGYKNGKKECEGGFSMLDVDHRAQSMQGHSVGIKVVERAL